VSGAYLSLDIRTRRAFPSRRAGSGVAAESANMARP
jgi:hypothetical protein